MSDDGKRLYGILAQEELQPFTANEAAAFSDAAKDEVSARIAKESPANPFVLSRLDLIRTPANRGDQRTAYLANLRAASPDSRRAAIAGLDQLGDPKARDAQIDAAMDDDDAVAATACTLLLKKKSDPAAQKRLEEVLSARSGNAKFYLTVSFLQGSGISPPVAVASRDGGSGGRDGG